MTPNPPMTEGEALAVDVSKVSAEEAKALGRADFCNFLRYCAEQEPAGSTYNTILNECSSRIITAHTAASGGEVVCWRMRRTNCLTGEWAKATPWQDGAPDAEDVRDAERVSPDGKLRYRIEYAYRTQPAAVPADALERLVEKWRNESDPRGLGNAARVAQRFIDELAALIPKGADHG